MKIIWHRISIQTLLFQACLPTRQNGVENRDKAYYARSNFEGAIVNFCRTQSHSVTYQTVIPIYFYFIIVWKYNAYLLTVAFISFAGS